MAALAEHQPDVVTVQSRGDDGPVAHEGARRENADSVARDRREPMRDARARLDELAAAVHLRGALLSIDEREPARALALFDPVLDRHAVDLAGDDATEELNAVRAVPHHAVRRLSRWST